MVPPTTEFAVPVRWILSVVIAFCGWTSLFAEGPSDKAIGTWQKEGWPLLKRFCLDCHNPDDREADLDLSGFENLSADHNLGSEMKRVLEMVRFGAMPPEDAELPTNDERKLLGDSIDRALYAVSCDLRPRPGKVTARRLNRAEYNNSIRDLFGMDLRPADRFPSDEVGGGFDNNADVLSMSPTMIEKYLDAAEYVAERVVIDPKSLPRLDKDIASDHIPVVGETKTGRFNGRFIQRDGFAWFEFQAPYSGEYRIGIRGGLANKGKIKHALYDQSGLLLDEDEIGYFGGGGSSSRIESTVKLSKGTHRFYLQPVFDERELKEKESKSDFFASVDEQILIESRNRIGKPLKPDNDLDTDQYAFMYREISISGPRTHDKSAYPPSQFQLVRRTARYDKGVWRNVEDAAKECLKPLMRRAFRTPVTDDDVKPYAELARQVTDRGESYYTGLQVAISAVLTSPRFLFRVQSPPDDWEPSDDQDAVRLTEYQLATRLSYFLWSSTPDEQLLSEAEKGRLFKNLDYHVRRMIKDPKAQALGDEFAAQWLGLRNLDVHEADTDHFADFDPKLMKDMAVETKTMFLHLLRENRPISELLTADFSFLNSDLAKYYGVDTEQELKGDEFRKVSLRQSPRRGILSHASILTLTSNPNRTSPVKRGKWILVNVLGTPPPDPPPGVPELEETNTADAKATLREQLELHRESATCASCHRVMDQLGFGLEQFDAIGRYREIEDGKPVDATGQLPGGRNFDGAAELTKMLANSEREAFAKTAIEKMLGFAIGRELTPDDRCTIDEIVAKSKKNDFRLIDLVLAVTKSRPFQYYNVVLAGNDAN